MSFIKLTPIKSSGYNEQDWECSDVIVNTKNIKAITPSLYKDISWHKQGDAKEFCYYIQLYEDVTIHPDDGTDDVRMREFKVIIDERDICKLTERK